MQKYGCVNLHASMNDIYALGIDDDKSVSEELLVSV